jgi:sarcosine oxidase
MLRYDVIVIGLGALGSAATYQLSRRGAVVLGIDRFSPPHKFGSSHGETRITRMAVGEGAEYTPLALRSRALWRAIEKEDALDGGSSSQVPLFQQCGCLTISGPNDMVRQGVEGFFQNIRYSARKYDIPFEEFGLGKEIRDRFPQFAVEANDRGFLDLWGGFLRPEECIATQLRLATKHKATIRLNAKVTAIRNSKTGVAVAVESGEEFEGARLLIAAGPWLPTFLPGPLRSRFVVTRQVLHWFEVKSHPERFSVKNCPVFIWDLNGRKLSHTEQMPKAMIYGFPSTDSGTEGLKVTHEEIGSVTTPDDVSREVKPNEISELYDTYIKAFMPDVGPRSIRTEVCLYTNTKGARFVIDRHPDYPRAIFASACSGHGFKHSAALGEALAETLMDQPSSEVDLTPFTIRKLGV